MTTRAYVPAAVAELESLAAGGALSGTAFVAAADSADVEEAEYYALAMAAEASAAKGPHRCVIAVDAEVDFNGSSEPDVVTLRSPVTLDVVAAFHLGLDGDEHLGWYATQEIGTVLTLLGSTAPTAD